MWDSQNNFHAYTIGYKFDCFWLLLICLRHCSNTLSLIGSSEGLRLLPNSFCRLKWSNCRYSPHQVSFELEAEDLLSISSKLLCQKCDIGKIFCDLKPTQDDFQCILCTVLMAKQTAQLCSHKVCDFRESMLFFWPSFGRSLRPLKSCVSIIPCLVKLSKIFPY